MLTCCLVLTMVGAQSSARTQQLEEDIADYRNILAKRSQEILSLDRELGELSSTIDQLIRERNELSRQLLELSELLDVLEQDILELEASIHHNQELLAALSQDVEALKERLSRLIYKLYRQSSARYARILLESESLFDLRVRNYYLSLLTEQDLDLIREAQTTSERLQSTQETLNQEAALLQSKREALARTQLELEQTQAALHVRLVSLENSREGKLAQRRDLLESQEVLEKQIDVSQQSLDQEIARLHAEAEEVRRQAQRARDERERERLQQEAERASRAATALSNIPSQNAEESFFNPLTNAQLGKAYGEDGPYVYLQAREQGAAVFSVMSGIITNSELVSANSGYLVTVQHSRVFITTYMNLQKPHVAVGDSISQGQLLGYLGGGALIPGDILQFRMGVPEGNRVAWLDPSEELGF